jgi:hypothetical protein
MKPFSSSTTHHHRQIPTKTDILKINSKLELIKSRVMKNKGKLMRSDSKKTMPSSYMLG